MNCLEHCLLQWEAMPDYRLWYNSDHVVIIEPNIDLHDKGYLPIEDFGIDYFKGSFRLSGSWLIILEKYFETINN